MRILLADDHTAIRIGLKHILKREFSNVVFMEATTSSEVLNVALNNQFDLIILDVNMPGRSGLDILRQLSQTENSAPVLVFSFHSEDQVAIRALKSGASGFLTKDAPDTEIIKAVNQIRNGRKYITLSVAEAMASRLSHSFDCAPHELLSEREYETLLLIASGKSVSEIARELSLGVPTISTYRARILEKMNMTTNAQLTRYVIEHELN
jgi:two-component system, NarL family, invasion response regulator UvrY